MFVYPYLLSLFYLWTIQNFTTKISLLTIYFIQKIKLQHPFFNLAGHFTTVKSLIYCMHYLKLGATIIPSFHHTTKVKLVGGLQQTQNVYVCMIHNISPLTRKHLFCLRIIPSGKALVYFCKTSYWFRVS